MNCRDFQEIVDSYLSDELLTETNHNIMRHLEACSACADVIDARRTVRFHLKSAVIGSPDFQLSENFDHNLLTRIRHEHETSQTSRFPSWFGIRSLALAAGLLLVGLLGFTFVANLNQSAPSSYLVSGFADDNLVNIATGDHQHCAIKYDLEEKPVSIDEAEPNFVGLDKVIENELGTTLAGQKLVESHACRYKNVRFAHYVMKGNGETVSILVAPSDQDEGTVKDRISEFSSSNYEVSRFDVNKNAVFVISGLERDRNRKAAESLAKPFERHFAANKGFQTAMLMGY